MTRETITRRNLPHWFVPNAWHFVTYRLVETIPAAVLHQLRETRDTRWRRDKNTGTATAEIRDRLHKQFFAEYDRYLDHNCAIDWLAQPKVAAIIRSNLYHHHGSKYHLLAYCIMPNHVHVLFRALEPETQTTSPSTEDDLCDDAADAVGPLSSIMHSLKSYTANKANKALRRKGQFWQHESYDHWVRDEDELQRIVDYIMWNPVEANLAKTPHEWLFCSAHDRFLQDGEELGFLLFDAGIETR